MGTNWEAVGAVASVLTFLAYLYVEREKFAPRAAVAGALASVLVWGGGMALIAYLLLAANASEDLIILAVISGSPTVLGGMAGSRELGGTLGGWILGGAALTLGFWVTVDKDHGVTGIVLSVVLGVIFGGIGWIFGRMGGLITEKIVGWF
jgi:hypothetical protein